MVHITMEGEASPGGLLIAHEGSSPRELKYSGAVMYRSDSRMSLEGTSEEEDSGFRDRSHSDTKTSSSETSFPSASPNSLSHDDAGTSPRARAVLDLSMTSSPFKKRGKKEHQARRGSFSHALVPPYSPLSSNASMSSSSASSPHSASPSVSPEVQHHAHPPSSHHGEVSIHDIAKEVVDRRSLHAVTAGPSTSYLSSRTAPLPPPAGSSSFDLPKNFYGYYVYQLELASRASHRQQGLNSLASNPQSPRSTPPLLSKAGKGASGRGDDETVSYGSLLEQALRNGLKRSPSEVPSTAHVDKRLKSGGPTSTPPPPAAPRQPSTTSQQISVEDVAKSSLRELLHSKQMQEAKAHHQQQQQHMSAFVNATGGGSNSCGTSRSSSPSVNLKTLLETQTREALKGSTAPSGFAPVYPKHGQSPMAGHGGRYNSNVPTGQQAPLIYPHVFNRSSSPSPPSRGPEGPSAPSMFLNPFQSQMSSGATGNFKHKKLLEWSANDVRDWVATLSYCSEFADAFVQQSVDGVALTLLNETHLMKNFQMKLGPAIKLRCAVFEIFGLCQTAQMPMPLGPMAGMQHFLGQKQLPLAFPLPQHHASLSKQ